MDNFSTIGLALLPFITVRSFSTEDDSTEGEGSLVDSDASHLTYYVIN